MTRPERVQRTGPRPVAVRTVPAPHLPCPLWGRTVHRRRSLVAELDDEVLVVDELPRYHLGGCRSLAGIPVIPLPAREAVELGFTPCAWCNPDRTLAARHRATVR